MKKETISTYGLIDLKALNKVVKSSDCIYYFRDSDGLTTLCNTHWAMRVYIPENSDVFATLCGMFHGVPDTCKRASARGVEDADVEFDRILSIDDVATVKDTYIKLALPDGRDVRILRTDDGTRAEYVGIDEKYHAMVYSGRAFQSAASGKNPVMFTNDNERVMICPIRIDDFRLKYLK